MPPPPQRLTVASTMHTGLHNSRVILCNSVKLIDRNLKKMVITVAYVPTLFTD